MKDAIKRVKGVGHVEIFGERRFAMRLWLDPNKLAEWGLVAADVTAALAEQNLQAPAGQLGQQPAPVEKDFQISLQVQGRLSRSASSRTSSFAPTPTVRLFACATLAAPSSAPKTIRRS